MPLPHFAFLLILLPLLLLSPPWHPCCCCCCCRPNITITCLNYAVVVLWSQSSPSLSSVWRNDVGGMCACGLAAGVTLVIIATCVLPTVASEEVSTAWGGGQDGGAVYAGGACSWSRGCRDAFIVATVVVLTAVKRAGYAGGGVGGSFGRVGSCGMDGERGCLQPGCYSGTCDCCSLCATHTGQ